MKKEHLLYAIGQVKEEYIAEASPENKETRKKSRRYTWVKWGALAAGICIIAGISIKTMVFPGKCSTITTESLEGKNENTTATDTTREVTDQTTSNPIASTNTNITENIEMDTNVGNSQTIPEQPGTEHANTEALPVKPDVDEQTGSRFGDEGFPNWGIALSVKHVTATGLTLVCTQSDGEPTGTLQTGTPFRLITLVDGTWKEPEYLPLEEGVERGWNSIAYLVPMEDTVEWEISWEYLYGELPAGTYRMVKEFMDFRKTADYDTAKYWVEFEIE